MALPAAADFTGATITEAQFKTAMTDLRAYLAGLLGTDGNTNTAQSALDVIFGAGVVAKSGAYTVTADDRGQLINATGTWTLGLPTAASAGAGFAFAIRNTGAGTITIDPNASETIDGATTLDIVPGVSAVVVSTGAAWVTVGRAVPVSYPISVANGGTGVATVAAAQDALSVVKRDHGAGAVGSLALLYIDDSGADVVAGGTYSGGSLKFASVFKNDNYSFANVELASGGTPAGTWRAMQTNTRDWNERPIFLAQRIA